MRAEVKTVATKHAQVWLREDTEGLGWYRGPVLLTALGTSFDTWADMTHTLPAERAHRIRAESEYDRARSVAYFCAALPDAVIAKLKMENARPARRAPAEGRARSGRAAPQGDATRLAACLQRRKNDPQLEIGRHVQANFEGSDRYTLSLPGSLACRISPLDRSVENMTIAGDWTACGLDAGCIEAAVMSGMLAACAISGKPHPSTIIGYDHP